VRLFAAAAIGGMIAIPALVRSMLVHAPAGAIETTRVIAPADPMSLSNPVLAAVQVQTDAKYLGAATCAGPACHGKAEAGDRSRSQQTEFTTWSTKDKHHLAYAVLASPESLNMSRRLKMEKPPQDSEKCLSCHSMSLLDASRRGQDFKLTDGVSCDGCHGPAERWFGTHLNEPYAESVKKGMNDIRNPVVRGEMCLSCHAGNRSAGRTVDHEMLAAGHPPLTFELDTFSQMLPPHWRPQKPTDDRLPRAQLWAVGQIVGLREAIRIVQHDAESGRWPEYSTFDCSPCHHDLKDSGWKKKSPPRTLPPFSIHRSAPGRPIWQASQAQFWTCAAAWSIVGDDSVPELFRELPALERAFLDRPFGDRAVIRERCGTIIAGLDEMIGAVSAARAPVDSARAIAAARKLCEVAEPLSWRGPSAAREIAFALMALLDGTDVATPAVAHELKLLVEELTAPEASAGYDPSRFSARVAAIRQRLGAE
jgi:hypothetical protein